MGRRNRIKLAILLATGPETGDIDVVAGISKAARTKGHGVSIFLMADGVRNVDHRDTVDLANRGVRITVCALNAGQKGVKPVSHALFGSQYDLSVMAKECDRLVGFC